MTVVVAVVIVADAIVVITTHTIAMVACIV